MIKTINDRLMELNIKPCIENVERLMMSDAVVITAMEREAAKSGRHMWYVAQDVKDYYRSIPCKSNRDNSAEPDDGLSYTARARRFLASEAYKDCVMSCLDYREMKQYKELDATTQDIIDNLLEVGDEA